MERVGEITDYITTFAVCQAVANDEPLDRADGDGEDGGHDGCEGIGAGAVSRVGDADSRYDTPALLILSKVSLGY